jgi:O-antigen/teichoic acid export membrane protein
MPDSPSAGASEQPERRGFLRNALTSYGNRALLAVSVLVVTPFLFRRLGPGGFGTWSVMFTLTTVFSMLEVGFGVGTSKFIAEHRATGQRRQAEEKIGASVVLNVGFGLLALIVSALFALLAPGLASAGDVGDFRAGMLILGVGFCLRFPLAAYGAVLTGYQRWDLYNIGQAVTVVGSAIGAVAVVAAGAGVLGVAAAYSAGFVAGGLTYLVLLKRLDTGLRLLPRASDRVARRTVLGFNSFTLLADSMMFVGERMDTVVIAAIRSARAAAPYAAANKLQSGIQALTLPVINLMLPMISDLEARGRRDAVIKRFVFATRVTLQVTIPVAFAVALFSKDIVTAWLGPSAPPVTASIVTVLAVQTLMLCAVPADKVLIGVGRARTVGYLNTAEGLSNLAISVVLVSLYGAIGAALGTLISSYLIGPSKFVLSCRTTGYPLARLIRGGLLPGAMSSVPSIVAMVGVRLLLPQSAGRFLLGLTLSVGVAALIALLEIGPGRTLREIRTALGRAQPEPEAAATELLA